MSNETHPEAWDDPEADPLEDLNDVAKRLLDHDFLAEEIDTEKEET